MATWRRTMLSGAAALAVTCSLLGSGPGAQAAGTGGIRRSLAVAVNTQRKKLGIPGVIVMARDPRLGRWTATFGTGDRATGQRIRAVDHFRIASITKSFVGTLILQLVQEHRLRLRDRLSRWVPFIPYARQITIRQLLNHTSGVRDFQENPVLIDAIVHQPRRVWTPWQLVRLSLFEPPYFAPGRGYHYSNTNYVLLGLIAAMVTRHSLRYQLRRHIFGPLSLRQTSFPLASPYLPRPFSHGYAPAGIWGPPLSPLRDYTVWSPSWDYAAGNVVSTAPDLMTWGKVLGQGSLLGPRMRAAQRTWVKTGPASWEGLGIARTDLEGVRFLGYAGADPGYSSADYYAPRLRLTIVVLANRCCDDPYAAGHLLKTVARQIIGWERSQRHHG